jgi:hypothetical protein
MLVASQRRRRGGRDGGPTAASASATRLPKGRSLALEVDRFDKPGAAVLRAFEERAEAVVGLLS